MTVRWAKAEAAVAAAGPMSAMMVSEAAAAVPVALPSSYDVLVGSPGECGPSVRSVGATLDRHRVAEVAAAAVPSLLTYFAPVLVYYLQMLWLVCCEKKNKKIESGFLFFP